MIRTLTFTTLFPNSVQPTHGVFVETRLRHLLASGRVTTSVLAPVPWFPLRHRAFGHYATLAAVPAREQRLGVSVVHPRYPAIPKLGMNLAPWLLYQSARRAVRAMLRAGDDFDLIDAHYFYPDGVAAVRLAREFGKPVAITGRGTDLHHIPQYPTPRRLIRAAALAADALITVSAALAAPLVELGVPRERITVLRNGVDLELFRPLEREAIRAELGLARTTAISVGNLIPLKGHDIVIRAIASVPEIELLIVGAGPEDAALKALVAELGLGTRVRFLGRLTQAELARVYSAADVLFLASSREGWPNVLLEAMACGTPVIVTSTWGTPEVVTAPEAGLLVPERTPEAFAAALRQLLGAPPARKATRRYAEGFGWDATTAGQITVFERILATRGQTRGA